MGTCNFPIPNASKYYAFGMNKYVTQEDINDGYREPEELDEYDELRTSDDYEWALDFCKEELEKKDYSPVFMGIYAENFDGAFMEKEVCFSYAGLTCKIRIQACVLSGHYEGAIFDYDADIDIRDAKGYWVGKYDLFGNYAFSEEYVVSDNLCDNAGMSKMQAKNIESRVYAELNKLTEKAEKIFQKCSEYRLGCVAVFSNGEAIYCDLERISA